MPQETQRATPHTAQPAAAPPNAQRANAPRANAPHADAPRANAPRTGGTGSASGAGEIVRRVLVFAAFTLVVAGLVLMWFSLTDGWQVSNPFTHAWAMALGATGVGLIAVVVFGVATIFRSVLAVTGLALGLFAANAVALDNAVFRWAFIILGGLAGWGLGAAVTASCAALFRRG